MSDATHYDMTMSGEGFDPEFIIYRVHRDVPNARDYLDINGKATGNGYDWRTLEQEMRGFSANNPAVLFKIVERGSYDGESFEFRHYFKGGKYRRIEPIVTIQWPLFADYMLS